ncbi:hypothetical protein SAMN05192574_101419 [Mucilaginibacter gossypiicola]|uniref:Uncharacterized protein n=1 Tax=Mucilaginibacter gossypiicola TaxID=551995 RepID=A0A1H8ABR1_9SPHI|nr:hypothetical protein SAMN05192574_101419 [Mucilaginibacter gossypiicola]
MRQVEMFKDAKAQMSLTNTSLTDRRGLVC